MKSLASLCVLLFAGNLYAGSFLAWNLNYKHFIIGKRTVEIRYGHLEASPDVPFKGNILYYEGLGDSMLNHDPLFSVLTKAGFRVIAFDYMGQGGSAGSMNNTTIKNINELGDQVLGLLCRKDQNEQCKYNIVGWSTGGLAAYRMAHKSKDKNLKSVVLLAPGIAPNYLVGEGLFNWPIDEITLRTLTNNRFDGLNDPHEDPVRPNTPVIIPKFAYNLATTARIARLFWKIPKEIPGLVLLSGKDDTYVNAKLTHKVLKRKAPHFQVKQYEKALHEIDNEVEAIAANVRRTILNFLKHHN